MEKVKKTSTKKVVKKVAAVKKVANKKVEIIAADTVVDKVKEIAADMKEMGTEIMEVTLAGAKNVADKVDFTETANKVMATAKNINKEVAETATEVVADMKVIAGDVKKVAKKSIKEAAKKVNFTKSKKQVKAVANKMTKEIEATTTEMVTEVKEKGAELKANTLKLANDTIENLKINDRIEGLKNIVKNTNTFALNTTESFIETLEENNEKWAKVADKAIKTGLKMYAKNENMVFATIDAVATQVSGKAKRFKKMFNN